MPSISLCSARACSCTTLAQPGNVSWENFENFVASFRVLKSRMIPDRGEVELARLHAGARLNLGKGIRIINRHLVLRQAIAQYETKASPFNDLVLVKCLSDEGSQGPMEVRMGDGRDCIINGSGASAGDIWHRSEVVGESLAMNEVGQCKLYKDRRNLSSESFSNERKKSANATDLFIFYTTAKDCGEIRLPPRSGIVDGDNWNEYFGPFAGRTYRLRCHAARQELKSRDVDEELEKSPRKRTHPGGSPDPKKRRTAASGPSSSR